MQVTNGSKRSNAASKGNLEEPADQAVLNAICKADKELLAAIIQPLTKNRIKNDWLKHALELDQFECFQLLLRKKETVRFDVFTPYMVYGKALKKQDTRYLVSLIEHGAYSSFTKNFDLGSVWAEQLFRRASAESLRFLVENGYTFGLSKGLEGILGSPTYRKAGQLGAIPENFYWSLNVHSFCLALEYFTEEGMLERVERLISGRDANTLLQATCDMGEMQSLNRLIKIGIELGPVNSLSGNDGAAACRRRVKEARKQLVELLHDIACD